jgi:hypothetical protein
MVCLTWNSHGVEIWHLVWQNKIQFYWFKTTKTLGIKLETCQIGCWYERK